MSVSSVRFTDQRHCELVLASRLVVTDKPEKEYKNHENARVREGGDRFHVNMVF